jgi:fibronectin-binding autotransporter adhesin
MPMKNVPTLAAVLCAAALLVPVARAQDLIVGSNSSGVTTNFTSGTNAYFETFVGYDPGADSNALRVFNTDTLLTNSGGLAVGLYGSGNNLVVADGGTVAGLIGMIGIASTSSNNSVLVIGAGSLWTNSNLYVGLGGSGNSLVISGEGTVANESSVIADEPTSSNNSVLVTGAGSLWTNSYLYAGRMGSGNSLVISDGGTVASA